MDSWVWAQLPDESIAGGRLREMVLSYIIHKPCGSYIVDAPCMQRNGDTNTKSCNNYYPQPFRATATLNERSGRAEYCTTKNGDAPTVRNKVGNTWVDVPVGNQWVVPYNPYLLILLDCHVCTDVVTAASYAKCLHKYIKKGEDFAKARISGNMNEIEMYRTTRYISAAEATWRMLGFDPQNRYPSVIRVHAHLENENSALYPAEASAEERAAIASNTTPDLMHYVERPTAACFSGLTCLTSNPTLLPRKKKDDPCPSSAPAGKWLDQHGNIVSARTTERVCRIHFESPAVGDLFYLRLLLHKIPARPFTELRTVQPDIGPPVLHLSFHDAARARGLITGDEEYSICMQEAIGFETGYFLRGLLITLILNGGPAPKLWHHFQNDLIEDLRMSMTRAQAVSEALRQIHLELQLHGKDIEQFKLPPAIHQLAELQSTRGAFDRIQQKTYADEKEVLLTPEQRAIYTTVINSITSNRPGAYMADSPAGTRKTFTEKVIAARLRGDGRVVLTIASTGIAALQLPGGWTAHSMFKLPLEDSLVSGVLCDIRGESQRAELIRKCDLIIWDGLPMTHKYCVEALNKTLQDLLNNTALFGDKIILFSGDWRQVGPVVKYGSALDTVEAAVILSFL